MDSGKSQFAKGKSGESPTNHHQRNIPRPQFMDQVKIPKSTHNRVIIPSNRNGNGFLRNCYSHKILKNYIQQTEFEEIVDNVSKLAEVAYSEKKRLDNQKLSKKSKYMFFVSISLVFFYMLLMYYSAIIPLGFLRYIGLLFAIVGMVIMGTLGIRSYTRGITHVPTFDQIVKENIEDYFNEINQSFIQRGLWWRVVPGHYWLELRIDQTLTSGNDGRFQDRFESPANSDESQSDEEEIKLNTESAMVEQAQRKVSQSTKVPQKKNDDVLSSFEVEKYDFNSPLSQKGINPSFEFQQKKSDLDKKGSKTPARVSAFKEDEWNIGQTEPDMEKIITGSPGSKREVSNKVGIGDLDVDELLESIEKEEQEQRESKDTVTELFSQSSPGIIDVKMRGVLDEDKKSSTQASLNGNDSKAFKSVLRTELNLDDD